LKLQNIRVAGKTHALRNIVVIIGPNNAGKTRLLEDLHYELVNSYERTPEADYVGSVNQNTLWNSLVGENDFTYTKAEADEWIKSHIEWKKSTDNASGRTGHMMYRSSNSALQWDAGVEGVMYEDELNDIKVRPMLRRQWLVRFKKAHIDIARIDSRFSEAQAIESIDISNNDNPKLFYAQTTTLKKLNEHLCRLFGKKFVVFQYSPVQYRVLLLNEGENNYPKWARTNNFQANMKTVAEHSVYVDANPGALISAQSHGTRAAAGILLALADKHRKIIFVDEPESHIYPAARKYIANLIAATASERQYILVTHDGDMLERLASSRQDFTVLKVNREREIKVVDFDAAQRRRTSAELKNSKALRAGFNDIAIFVEGPSDRYVYEAIMRRKKMISDDTEYGVIDCDGNDRIADSVKFSFDIGTKVAVITDFDTLFTIKNTGPVIDRIIESMNAPESLKSKVAELRSSLMGVVSKKKGLSAPQLTPVQIKNIEDIINELKPQGIFIVPKGELFDWFTANKNEFPVEVLRNRYFNNSKKYADLTKFLEAVAKYAVS
jgi:AAA15 family ATPase/GTPase